MKSGRILVVESKGNDRDNSDSKSKLKLGKQWASLAGKSYRYFMVPICPRCGAKLVLRTAKKGANAGNQFYGCSAFPKCRYIQNIDKTNE